MILIRFFILANLFIKDEVFVPAVAGLLYFNNSIEQSWRNFVS